MIDLSGRLCVSKSGITQLVDRLQEAGLVEREASTSDRRLTYAKITSQGRKALRHAQPVIGSAVEEHFARHLSGDEMRSLHESLLKVLMANTVPAAS
jgi:DNA-binding MarR family transcriptional regulator